MPGNLPRDVHESEVEDLFHKLTVKLAQSDRGSSRGRSCCRRYSGEGSGAPRHSSYYVLVTGLPSSASLKELKDHMRCAGDVSFSQVFQDCYGVRGIVDYSNYDDMKDAIRKLDNSLFCNKSTWDHYIRVEVFDHGRSMSRSPSYNTRDSTCKSPGY
ncbi:OLC1v1012963C1 [Oldenlandia corymbosa var. corymbosa]|uniref:OLC1v1012963C1 n=1 Tax=Oldenlandia corymbosa var. corymbosa TaxID=529605 RepID=A0AAV1DXU9_OLDCO|nr:OLC1v1012963C1 [Oldenlandia corymbosa var. corymbosa]